MLKTLRPGAIVGAAILVVGAATVRLPAATPDSPAAAPTFSKDVAPIFYKNCTSCHRPGEIAPMSLLTYKDARPWAKAIREAVVEGDMPPWFADPKYGSFHNERRLSDRERDTIIKWVNAGAREGNPADLPTVPQYADGWTIKPDVVFELPVEYQVPGDGTVDYQYFDVPTNFTEDKWVQAVEVRPGDRAHVHHVIVYWQEPKPTPRPRVVKLREDISRTPPSPGDPKKPLGSTLAAVATGTEPAVYPDGVARKIAAGSNLTFQIHYTTNGAPGKDRTKVGIVFAKRAPEYEMRSFNLINGTFKIPAGAKDYKIDADVTFTEDVRLWAMLPHTHLRGTAWEYRAVYPDGRSEIILKVPKYDFSWQTDYAFKEPLKLPKGTRIEATAWYDNSASNPGNPDPTKDVVWGDQTWDEMMFTAIRFTVESARMTAPTAAAPQQ